jgi:hypothetical protein
MQHLFTTEVEFEDENGNVEIRQVTTEMASAEAVAAAEAAYTADNISHDQAVMAANAVT